MIPQNHKILVVSKDEPFTDEIMQFSIQIAKRLGYDLIGLNVKTVNERIDDMGERFKAKAGEERVSCDVISRVGNAAEIVEAFHHEVKRVEFVITGYEEDREELAGVITIPVFSVISNPLKKRRRGMAEQRESRKRLMAKTIGYGIVTAALYAAIFLNAKPIMTYFTKGSWYAALPIATVFVFSIFHGAFASNFWSLLGINAMKKGEAHETVQDTATVRPRPRKRPRKYAYVNPFHRV